MRKVLVAMMVVGVLTLAFANAYAQGTEAKATVPFPFIVGETVVPAGSYFVSTASDVLAIRNSAGRFVAGALLQANGSWSQKANALLSFQKIGGRYFLSEVSVPGSVDRALLLPKSHVASMLAKLNGTKAAPVGPSM